MPSPWEDSFRKGVEAFHSLDYQKALTFFDTAINRGAERYIAYDSRAAVYERIGKIKNALKDSRTVIELAPHRRHGYTRSARLFLMMGKHDNAMEMVRLALDRVKADDMANRTELEALRQAVLDAKALRAVKEAQKRPHVVKLPVELISEIFTVAAELDNDSPICLSLVCTHWRLIALSSPALWRCLSLSRVRPAPKMELWQERSKGRITGLRICAGISRLQLEDVFAKCAPDFFKSLKSFYCEVDPLFLSTCMIIAPNFFDLDLEEICISNPKNRLVEMASPLAPLVPMARKSSARSLKVEYVDMEWAGAVPQLTHLHTLVIKTESPYDLPSAALILTLLEANQQLEEVILETESPWDLNVARPDKRIELPHLSHLQLLGPMDTARIIAWLFLPNLKRLAINHSLCAVDETILVLDPPLPLLTELTIRKCTFSETRLATFLQHMNVLTKLEITHSGSRMDIIVEALAGTLDGVQGETRVVCPGLRHVDFSHSPNLNGGPVLRFVKPRLRTIEATGSSSAMTSKINVLNIDGCPRVDPAVPQWLKGKIEYVSCVYMTKDDIKKMSRRKGLYQ